MKYTLKLCTHFYPTFCGNKNSWYIGSQSNNKNCFLIWSGIGETHKTMQALTPQVCRLHHNKETLFPRLSLVVSSFVLRHKEVNKCPVLALLLCYPTWKLESGQRGVKWEGMVANFSCQLIYWREGKEIVTGDSVFKVMVKILLEDSVIFPFKFIFLIIWIVLWLGRLGKDFSFYEIEESLFSFLQPMSGFYFRRGWQPHELYCLIWKVVKQQTYNPQDYLFLQWWTQQNVTWNC